MSADPESLKTQAEDLEGAFEFIPGRLYYVPLRNKPHKQKKAAFFSIDEELVYWNFFLDFGPLNLGQLYRFCQIVRELLEDPKLHNKTIYYYSAATSQKKANAAYLISSFAMLCIGRTPEQAFAPFANTPLPPFHDATPGRCTYSLSVLDCLRGIDHAVRCGHVDFPKFNIDEYEYFERVECGDLNWLVKDKFLAFAGPHEYRMETSEGFETLVPEDYIPYFKKAGVKLVIRLNKKCYDEQRFVRAGIKHLDLFYADGTNPPPSVLRAFLEACEAEPGAIAVHCKAGLGRTGTCIGCYMMKHWDYSAAETIGWLRVCRPGSVIGPQQHYLEEIEPVMRAEGRRLRAGSGAAPGPPANARKGLTRAFDEFEAKHYTSSAIITAAAASTSSGASISSFGSHGGSASSIGPGLVEESKMETDEKELSQGDFLLSKKGERAAMQRQRMLAAPTHPF